MSNNRARARDDGATKDSDESSRYYYCVSIQSDVFLLDTKQPRRISLPLFLSDLRVHKLTHVSLCRQPPCIPSFPMSELSQSLSPPPGPSGLSFLSPPQSLVTINQAPTSAQNNNSRPGTSAQGSVCPSTLQAAVSSRSAALTIASLSATLTRQGQGQTSSNVGATRRQADFNSSIFQIPLSQDILAGANFPAFGGESQSTGKQQCSKNVRSYMYGLYVHRGQLFA